MALKKKIPVKAKRKTISTSSLGVSKRTDVKYIGDEITKFDSSTNIEDAIKQNLKYCNYFYTRQDAAKWIEEWVQKNMSPIQFREFKSAETWRSCISIGTLCRMHKNGANLPADRIEWMKTKIEKEILVYGRNNINSLAKPDNDNKPVISPATLTERKASEFIANLESVVDSWDSINDFSLYNDLKSGEIPSLVAKRIVDFYTPLLNELQEATGKKPDAQIKEAYSHFKTTDLKKYFQFISNIVNDAEMYLNGKKAERKPRKPKVKSATQLVTKVKYQKESKELKITSVSPEKIIGASVVLLFNTQYNTISYLVSNDKNGFTITGTTIQNIDNENSFKKTLRKASENLPAIVNAPKARASKMIQELKTVKSEATGRISEQVLILKVFA